MKTSKPSLIALLGLLLTFVLVALPVVRADNMEVDGDIVTPDVWTSTLNFGDVCAGVTLSENVALAIIRNGNYPSTNVFTNGTTVTFAVDSISGTGLEAVMVDDEISVPTDWDKTGNNVRASDWGNSAVTFTAGSAIGSFTGSIKYKATGTSSKDGTTITRPATLTVVANIVSCQTPGDTKSPTTLITLTPGTPNGTNDWYTTKVHVTVSATDDTGVVGTRCILDPETAPGQFSDIPEGCSFGGTGADVTDDGEHVIYAGSIDAAGNTDLVHVTFKIDQTPPALNINGAPSGSYDVCSIPERPSFSPEDATSGLDGTEDDSWTTPTTASGVGTYTYEAWATDNAGNEAHQTWTYTVTYGEAFSGFLPPVVTAGKGKGHFKLGSTIPVKFALLCGGTSIDNAVARLYVRRIDSTADSGYYEVASTSAATTGNLFRYDSVSQQYIFNLSTKAGYQNPSGTWVSFTAGTWIVEAGLDDGTYRSTTFDLK